jgi:hypothetical protein
MTPQGVVCDGYERWWVGASEPIRAAVEAEFAAKLRCASLWQRWQLRLEIEREVGRRMQDMPKPSPEALF